MRDNIKKPDHYCEGRKYEPKDVIRDWGLNFNLGSAVKYISRAGRKGDKLEDLQKAKQFLEFEIEAVEDAQKKASKEAFDKSLEALDECKATLMATRKKRFTDLNTGKDIWLKIEEEQKSDIGMSCKEAAEIGEAMAKGFEEGLKEAEETDTEIERKTSWYTNGILGQWFYYQNIPDEYKPRVIDKIAQEVLDSARDIENDISSDELRNAVIDRIVERINNGELTSMDIPTGLYEESRRIRAAIANSGYCKIYDTITITFNVEED